MEWPKELLEIFEDPLLDDVRPKVQTITPNDRMSQKLFELQEWIKQHGREPQQNGNLKEKMMWAAMIGLQKNNMI
jgi:hypothetical protein